jgi:hypothetical protein
VPLHTTTAPRRAGLARAATILAASGIAVGGVMIVAGDGQSTEPDGAIADSNQPAIGGYDDIEANKANSMRTLGIATMQAPFRSPYRVLEATKADTRCPR